MNPDLMIRPAGDGDFGAWLPLWQKYQTFCKTSIADTAIIKTSDCFEDKELLSVKVVEPYAIMLAYENGTAEKKNFLN